MSAQIVTPRTAPEPGWLDDAVYAAWYRQSIERPEGFWREHGRRRMTDCVRELTAAIDRAMVRHGHGTALAALVVIAANKAIDVGSGRLLAEAFRHNADMLDAHELVRTVAGHA